MSSRSVFDSKLLRDKYHSFKKGDIVKGMVSLKRGEESLLLDLTARGVILVPSSTSQLASRSKIFQARILGNWMVPGTVVIHDLHELLFQVSEYNLHHPGKVVVKQEHKNGGIGILLYSSIEDLYSQAANSLIPFPFVLQPFLADCTDIRVIILDNYIEAYQRHNPHNFRNNLHCGATATPHELTDDTVGFCRQIMNRGKFPYGHIDLMLAATGETYLAEINLRGGIHGARLTTTDYRKRVAAIEDRLAGNDTA